MGKTTIEWTDLSTNPIRARRMDGGQRVPGHYCEKISPGCANCYASKFQPRFHMPTFKGSGSTPVDQGVEVFLDEEVLKSLLNQRKPAKVFWCDMSDLFGSWVKPGWIDQCFTVMALTPHLTHQILTKRTAAMAEYLPGLGHRIYGQVTAWLDEGAEGFLGRQWDYVHELAGGSASGSIVDFTAWNLPLKNVHLGTSVENQKLSDERREPLFEISRAGWLTWISYEPALGPVDWTGWEFTRWLVSGGESGAGARPSHPDWHRATRDWCSGACVPYFFKQWGEYRPCGLVGDAAGCFIDEAWQTDIPWNPAGTHFTGVRSLKRQDNRQNQCQLMARVGKKAAGRMLDYRTWDEFPTTKAK